jgi:hypothetical protein
MDRFKKVMIFALCYSILLRHTGSSKLTLDSLSGTDWGKRMREIFAAPICTKVGYLMLCLIFNQLLEMFEGCKSFILGLEKIQPWVPRVVVDEGQNISGTN